MILDDIVNIKINNYCIEHYRELGYIVKEYDLINIPVYHLLPTSHQMINVKCDVCGKEKKLQYRRYLLSFNNRGYYSCSDCKKIKTNEIIKEKYGVDNVFQNEDIKEKIKQTNLEKYGVVYPLKSESVKNKMKQTNIEKYGSENVFQNEKIKEKIKQTNLEKYGVERPTRNENIKTKLLDSLRTNSLKKYGVDNPLKCCENKLKAIINRKINNKKNYFKKYNNLIDYDDHVFIFKCSEGHEYTISSSCLYNRKKENTIICTICNPIHSAISGHEIELRNFIEKNYEGIIKFNVRNVIRPNEIDIYLPNLKLALEFNGLYWHNELNKGTDYHLKKTELAEKQGIKLIHIYEDDWLYKKEIVKSKILGLLGKSTIIESSKCEIKEITDDDLIEKFLKYNYLKNFIISDIKFGMFYKGDMISIMTFNKNENDAHIESIKPSYQIYNYCEKLNTTVVNGYRYLLSFFINKYKCSNITCIVDRTWEEIGFYENIGFRLIKKMQPDFFYIKNKKRENVSNSNNINDKENKIYNSGSLELLLIKD